MYMLLCFEIILLVQKILDNVFVYIVSQWVRENFYAYVLMTTHVLYSDIIDVCIFSH